METIVGLFESYKAARSAVAELQEREFDIEEMNAIIQEEVAKGEMDVDLKAVNVQVTDEVGEQTVHGLVQLLAGQQPVRIPGVGEVYAAGDMATTLAKTALAPGAVEGGMREALMNFFHVARETAEAYRAGIEGGGLLFWIRTDDGRAAEAASVLRQHEARHLTS